MKWIFLSLKLHVESVDEHFVNSLTKRSSPCWWKKHDAKYDVPFPRITNNDRIDKFKNGKGDEQDIYLLVQVSSQSGQLYAKALYLCEADGGELRMKWLTAQLLLKPT